MSQAENEKKIIVDEDWKSRVEAEKSAAQQEPAPSGTPPPKAAPAAGAPRPLPPPDLIFLAGTLYMQGMIGLGMMPNPVSGKAEASLEHAKHGIDSLDVLWTKTAGNRTADESQVMEQMLHELRMAYLAAVEKKT